MDQRKRIVRRKHKIKYDKLSGTIPQKSQQI